jgi:hypothetical protein
LSVLFNHVQIQTDLRGGQGEIGRHLLPDQVGVTKPRIAKPRRFCRLYEGMGVLPGIVARADKNTKVYRSPP